MTDFGAVRDQIFSAHTSVRCTKGRFNRRLTGLNGQPDLRHRAGFRSAWLARIALAQASILVASASRGGGLPDPNRAHTAAGSSRQSCSNMRAVLNRLICTYSALTRRRSPCKLISNLLEYMVPPEGIEPSTPPLPRVCSTPELRRPDRESAPCHSSLNGATAMTQEGPRRESTPFGRRGFDARYAKIVVQRCIFFRSLIRAARYI